MIKRDEIINDASTCHFRNNEITVFKNSNKNKRKILKFFLLKHLHQLFTEIFQNRMLCNQNNSLMESYAMDSKIIQILIHEIVATGEYTLEGIAYYTHIPFDVIYDAACGFNHQLSVTSWMKIIDLYNQVNPWIMQTLIDRLIELKVKNPGSASTLLTEI